MSSAHDRNAAPEPTGSEQEQEQGHGHGQTDHPSVVSPHPHRQAHPHPHLPDHLVQRVVDGDDETTMVPESTWPREREPLRHHVHLDAHHVSDRERERPGLERMEARLARLRTRRIAALVLLAIAVRVLIMPFTLHFDAYSIYSRAAEAAYDGQWFGFTSQFLIQGMHNVWLALIRPLLPDSAGIWSPTASVIGVGAGLDDYDRFMGYEHLYRVIFLMKVPYVIADLACAWVIAQLVPRRQQFAALALWLLNPLVIFSSAVWGRHDSVAILLVLLSLLAARRATDAGRLLGLLLLGVATLSRFFPAVILPLFLLAFRRNTRQLLTFVGLLGGMVALVELAAIATSGKSAILTVLSSYQHVEYWFDAGLLLRVDDWLAIFPIIWLLGLFWLLERGVTVDEYPTFSAAAFLLVFAFTFFHPHYAVWLVPFLAIVIPASPVAGRLMLYHGLQIICVFAYSLQWGAWSSWELFRPLLGDRVASLPDPYEAISGQIAPRVFFGTVRAGLTAASLWMLWLILPRPHLSLPVLTRDAQTLAPSPAPVGTAADHERQA